MKYSISIFEALKRASLMLEQKGYGYDDAEFLMKSWMNWNHSTLVMHYHDRLNSNQIRIFNDMIKRVMNDEPIQYIVGKAYFAGNEFIVTPDVLIPRLETEELLNLAIDNIIYHKYKNILDIGTGSGILAISLSKRFSNIKITATDISLDALKIAKINANKLKANVVFKLGDLFNAINENEKFDLILSNPPYVAKNEIYLMDKSVYKYEPHIALFAGDKGLDIYERLSLNINKYLSDKGQALFEIGYNQKNSLKKIFNDNCPNYKISFHKDVSGKFRIMKLYKEK